ncbi:methyltransferase [Daejeonella sp.]|uniref:class I SAM-dependent methyltransferase n=1 Tax=Daejeonella sp. TaxID=2805397 RepID=UPI0030C106CF
MISKALNYIKNIRTTGAVYESSRFVSRNITHEINNHKPQIVIELGAGSGNITERILSKLHPDSELYCFEIEPQFYEKLENIKDSRFHLIKESAADVTKYFDAASVDIIISGLPLSLFDNSDRSQLLNDCYSLLKKGGVFRQFLYSLQKNYFMPIFDHMEMSLEMNLPPAVLYSCYKLN